MRLLIIFARMYPFQSGIMLLALLLAGIAEGFSLTALLPLFATIAGGGPGGDYVSAEGASNSDSELAHILTEVFSSLGLTPTVGLLLAVIVMGVILKSIFMLLANKRVGYTVAHVATDLRLALLRAFLNARWEYYLGQPVGGLANAFASEAMRASRAYFFAAKMAAFFIEAMVYMSVALLVSWKATLASVAAGAILLYGLNYFVRMARRAGERQTSLLQSSLEHLTDSLQSMKPLKAMAREDLADVVLKTETKRLNKALQKQVFSKEALRSLQEPMIVSFLAFGLSMAIMRWAIPFASVMVLVFLLARLLTRLSKIQEQYQKMVIFESAYWSLQKKISKANCERESMPGYRAPSLGQRIRLNHVSFKYGESWVLNNTSLEFQAGLFTAITGASGAGKTTVVDLIMGLLQPQKGQIWIDEVPLQEVDIKSWRRMIGYVPQETVLLHDTIMRNVTFGDPELNEKDVKNALCAAGAWDFVMAMPQGAHSTVGERGGKLSGGQRQRIAIARALVHKPVLLILDEATSGLDSENEASIYNTLRRLRGKLTIIAISHQSALVDVADLAYSIQDGKVRLVKIRPDMDSASENVVNGTGLTS